MTIFEKIDFWSDQGCVAAIAAIFNLIWRTNDHDSANGTNFYFYIQTMYLQDIKSNLVYSEVHNQPN